MNFEYKTFSAYLVSVMIVFLLLSLWHHATEILIGISVTLIIGWIFTAVISNYEIRRLE